MMQMHDAELSQAYREAKHPVPSPALDARIQAAAQAAVAPQRRRPAWFGWAVPLSTMAVLVLGIGLLFRMQLEAPEALREDMPPLPAIELDAGPGASPATSLSTAPAARLAAPAAQAMAERQVDRTPAAPKQRPAPTVATTAPESAANEAEVASIASAPAAVEESAAIAPMPPPQPSSVADSAAVPAPASAPVPAAAAGASPARESAIRAGKESAAKAVSPSAARLKPDVSRMQLAAPMPDSPEQWVESIRKLLREGQIEAARIRLRELRKRFPDFPLPPDLEPSRCCPLPAAGAE